MRRNFSLRFRIADIFIIAGSLIAAIGLMVAVLLTNNPFSSKKYVSVYHQNALLEEYRYALSDLSGTIEIVLRKDDYPRLLGDFTIYVDPDKGIRVEGITCPNHDCEKQGWVNIANLPIVCIPNDVRVVIESEKGDGNEIIGAVFYEKKEV